MPTRQLGDALQGGRGKQPLRLEATAGAAVQAAEAAGRGLHRLFLFKQRLPKGREQQRRRWRGLAVRAAISLRPEGDERDWLVNILLAPKVR